MVKKNSFSLKRDIQSLYSPPRTPSKSVLYSDLLRHQIVELNTNAADREDGSMSDNIGSSMSSSVHGSMSDNVSSSVHGSASNNVSSSMNDNVGNSMSDNVHGNTISTMSDSSNDNNINYNATNNNTNLVITNINNKNITNKNNNTINNYNIDYKIGEGDYYVVYKTRNNTALKRSKTRIRHKQDIDLYTKEVDILKQLDSDYVTKYINSYTNDTFVYIEVEYCNLGTLREYMNKVYYKDKHKFNINVLHRIMYDISHGLHHIHTKNIVHMDMKPENIFIKGTHLYDINTITFVIGDFNISRHTSDDIQVDGDKKYMGPEVLQNICTKYSDIYALGLMYIEMKEGVCLPTYGDMYKKFRQDDFCGIQVDNIGRRMLSSDYKKRCDAEYIMDMFSKEKE